MRAALLPLALAFGAAAQAQEPPSLEAIGERYLRAETYCGAGRRGTRLTAKERFSHDDFHGCARRDGRFRFVEHPGPAQIVSWSDGENFHRYWESIRQYRVHALDADEVAYFGYRGAGAPVMQSRLFTRGAYDNPSLAGYRPSATLSDALHTVYERPRESRAGASERFWVRNEDKAILKYESVHAGEVLRFVELTSQELDRPLSDAELSHRVPPLARVSLQNNPAVFVALLLAAVLFSGALFWAWLFARSPGIEEVARKRRLLWKGQIWFFGIVAVLLVGLGVLSVATPDSGHPPFIVVVILMAALAAGAFALTAAFTLTSYVVQALMRRRA